MAKELGNGWIVTAVCPNSIEGSDMINEVIDRMVDLRGMSRVEADEYNANAVPLKRRQTMSEVAQMIAMALEANQFMTGSVFEAPGGGI